MNDPVCTIELGVACNNNCRFCPQAAMRRTIDRSLELSTDEAKGRMRQAYAEGYRRLGLIGGEPTVRPDLLDLLATARALGFREVSITSNGRRFAYAPFAQAALKAGLDGLSLSIHAPDAKRHDALVRAPGAFDQGLAGLDHLVALAPQLGVRLRLQSITLLARRTLADVHETIALLGRHGIALHLVQPFIVDIRLLAVADSLLVDRDEIAAAVRRAAAAAAGHGGRIKLFNFPPCLVADLGATLDREEYERVTRQRPDTTMRQRPEAAGDPMCRPLPGCAACPVGGCDGLRIDLIPQRELQAELEAALAAHARRHGKGEVWVAGLELATAATAEAVLRAAAARFGRVVLITSGFGRAGAGLVRAAARAGVARVWLLTDLGEPWHFDRLPRDGNTALCAELAGLARAAGVPEVRFLLDGTRLLGAERLADLGPGAALDVDLSEFTRDAGAAVARRVGACYRPLAARHRQEATLLGVTAADAKQAARRFLAHPLASRRIIWSERLTAPFMRPCRPE
ncbi:MAG TPA: radical SAM protein [Polyangia bacterium]|jgi:MoaA/NifB/PqqE/SkfB family radical SAM enzyme